MSLLTGSDGSTRNKYPEQQPDALHDGAAGGPFFSEAELPVVGTFSKPMTLGGFSPSPNRTEQLSSSQQGMNVGRLPPTGLGR